MRRRPSYARFSTSYVFPPSRRIDKHSPLGYNEGKECAYLHSAQAVVFAHAIRRGGYQPPAQGRVNSKEMLGEFVPDSRIFTIQPNTQYHSLAGGW